MAVSITRATLAVNRSQKIVSFGVIFALLFLVTPTLVFARAVQYAPGETLNPDCSPGESNCNVAQLSVNTTLNTFGIGTTSPYAKLSVVGEVVATYFSATSTTATSTFAGGLFVGGGALTYDFSSGITSIDDLQTGPMTFDTNAGILSWIDLPVTSTATAGTVESYSARIDGNSILTVYGESNGSGSVQNLAVGIGTSSPFAKLSVMGNTFFAGTMTASVINATSTTATSTFANGISITGGCIEIDGGCLAVGGGGGSPGGSSGQVQFNAGGGSFGGSSSFVWNNTTKRLGIGTTTPYAPLSVYGEVVASYFSATSTTATSTFANGIAITGGCLSVGGSCVGANSSVIESGTQGQFAFYNGTGTTLTATSTLFVSQDEKVGIGTSSPISTLTIGDDASGVSTRLNGSAFYYAGTAATRTTPNVLSYQVTTGTALNAGLYVEGINNSDTTNGSITNLVVATYSPVANSTDLNVIRGGNYFASHLGSGTLGNLDAFSATLTQGVGAGAITTMQGFSNNFNVTGTVTSLYGIRTSGTALSNSGTITDTFGVWVGDITAGTQTNTPFSFYASDDEAYNYFAGNTGIGTTSPGQKLSVAGDILGNNIIGTYFTATSTEVASTFPYASSTAITADNLFSTNLILSNFNGPIQANAGLLSATTSVAVLYGGTGLNTAPTYGQILVGNDAGGYTLTATSSLGTVLEGTVGQFPFYGANGSILTATSSLFLSDASFVGIGTVTPTTELQVVGTITTTFASTTVISSSESAYFATGGGAHSVGIGTTSPWRTLSVDGTIAMSNLTVDPAAGSDAICLDPVTKEVYVNSGNVSCSLSSARFKHNIQSLENGLSIVRRLRPVSFELNANNEAHLGFIAEEVAEVESRLIFTERASTTPRGVRYEEITAVLAKAIQEQQVQIEHLNTQSQTGLIAGAGSVVLDGLRFFGVMISETVTRFRDIFVETLHIEDRLCVDDVCLGKEELKTLLRNAGGVTVSAPSSASVVESSSNTPNNLSDVPGSGEVATSTESITPFVDDSVDVATSTESVSETGTGEPAFEVVSEPEEIVVEQVSVESQVSVDTVTEEAPVSPEESEESVSEPGPETQSE